jgi:hypothetical protein
LLADKFHHFSGLSTSEVLWHVAVDERQINPALYISPQPFLSCNNTFDRFKQSRFYFRRQNLRSRILRWFSNAVFWHYHSFAKDLGVVVVVELAMV